MPKLLDAVVLLVDREVVGSLGSSEPPRVIPRGSRGVLVDQCSWRPGLWTIEFSTLISPEIVLVEADEACFAVCKKDNDPA